MGPFYGSIGGHTKASPRLLLSHIAFHYSRLHCGQFIFNKMTKRTALLCRAPGASVPFIQSQCTLLYGLISAISIAYSLVECVMRASGCYDSVPCFQVHSLFMH